MQETFAKVYLIFYKPLSYTEACEEWTRIHSWVTIHMVRRQHDDPRLLHQTVRPNKTPYWVIIPTDLLPEEDLPQLVRINSSENLTFIA